MKNIKEFINKIIFTIAILFAFTLNVNAEGTVSATFTGSNNVTVGSTVSLTLSINSVSGSSDGKMYSIGGNLQYDNQYLEYVSMDASSGSGFNFSMNQAIYKFSLVDYSMSKGTSGGGIAIVKFKALKEGTTSVTLTNGSATDQSNNLAVNFTAKELTIGPAKNTDATLKSLGVTNYTLSPDFASSKTDYTINVPSGTTSVTITGEVNNSLSKVTGLGAITLTSDETKINVKVTAESGATKTYTITVKREKEVVKSSDATLKSLAVSNYSLNPSFDSTVTAYKVTVPYEVNEITSTGVANNVKATVDGLGTITLTNDETTKDIVVSAEDGTTKTYTLTIVKEKKEIVKSSDATLKSLYIGGYTLSPSFNSNTTSYTIKVGNAVDGLRVDAVPNDANAKVSVKGNSGWKVGNNNVTITVTAEDGTQKTYEVTVNRAEAKAKSNDTTIDLIINSPNSMIPDFSNSVNSYDVTVPNNVTSLDLTIKPHDSKTKYEVKNNNNLKVNEVNIITIVITAEDGTTREIKLNVTRTEEEIKYALLDLSVKDHEINPSFKPEVTTYKVRISSDEDEIIINTKLDVGASREIIGNYNLREGENSVLVKVTDTKGYTTYYEILVTKDASFKIFGLKLWEFLLLLGLILLLIFIIIILLIKRDNDDDEDNKNNDSPVINFKPEINFNSKNGTDDDIVYPNGNLYQIDDKSELKEIKESNNNEVTKDELIDAIYEGLENKNADKLKLLLEQEELNRKKEELEKENKWR